MGATNVRHGHDHVAVRHVNACGTPCDACAPLPAGVRYLLWLCTRRRRVVCRLTLVCCDTVERTGCGNACARTPFDMAYQRIIPTNGSFSDRSCTLHPSVIPVTLRPPCAHLACTPYVRHVSSLRPIAGRPAHSPFRAPAGLGRNELVAHGISWWHPSVLEPATTRWQRWRRTIESERAATRRNNSSACA